MTSTDGRLSRGALIATVVSSMVGSGIFALPVAFGRATGRAGRLVNGGLPDDYVAAANGWTWRVSDFAKRPRSRLCASRI